MKSNPIEEFPDTLVQASLPLANDTKHQSLCDKENTRPSQMPEDVAGSSRHNEDKRSKDSKDSHSQRRKPVRESGFFANKSFLNCFNSFASSTLSPPGLMEPVLNARKERKSASAVSC